MQPTQADIDRAAFLKRQKEKALELAAPDLLASLKQCIPYLEYHANKSGEGIAILQVAQAAIAKAEGVA